MTSSRALLFVEVDIDGKKRSKQARAHVARVNRQRQKQERQEQKRDSETARSAALTQRGHPAEASPLRRTIAPVFGALKYDAFTTKESIEAAEIASFCFGPIMNSWLDPQYKPTWIAAFFNHPLVYHSLSFSVGILQDVSHNRAVQPRRLMHQIRTIQLVNQQLDQLDTVDHEPILLAIISLWRISLDEVAEQRLVPLLFTPHLRQASFIATFGRLGGDGSHPAALLQLVNRMGGLGKFKTLPSLQESLALADVLDSSANATRPRFGNIWDTDSYLRQLKPALRRVSGDIEGQGFFGKVPGGLPIEATTALQHLGFVDKLLDDYSTRAVSQTDDFYCAVLSNVAQHELLSLPPWEKLADRGTYVRSSYELCRVASMIYSNSVIFPMSPGSGWLDKLLRQLRDLVEISTEATWDTDELPLLIWALVIGGVAAFWTGHRTFFLDTIRQALKQRGTFSLHDLLPGLRAFLWRDSTSMKGTLTVWEFMKMADGLGGPEKLQTILRSEQEEIGPQ
ncbi:hypothetical protein DOTSEDRAFT_79220 [Dothistroma septosporum NZE10]|uniref:Uncharacterized protein n=1 Tax=Dothistroma septosporum (strain NZE10 / CBS 128990) TaxID=675120 RepID=N1PNZ2_DOTSN|nr:hypothetical protein DOTSEDRAFT_79220 [Dothistroma septosporum NZE10]